MFSLWDHLFGFSVDKCQLDNLDKDTKYFPQLSWSSNNCSFVWDIKDLDSIFESESFCQAVNDCIEPTENTGITFGNLNEDLAVYPSVLLNNLCPYISECIDLTGILTSISNIGSSVSLLQGESHVPATLSSTNEYITAVAAGPDLQSLSVTFNIAQLPSADSNNNLTLGLDGKLYVSQPTLSAGGGFNILNTIALRDAQTGLQDGHITQVIDDPNPALNGFYIYDTDTNSWFALIPSATVISVNGSTGVVNLTPSNLFYIGIINGVSVTNLQEAIDELAAFVNNHCDEIADCIDNSPSVQSAILNYIENANINFQGDISFTGNTVTFDDSTVNFENNTTLNYDNTVVSNHNGDTINYDGSTINSENSTYNYTGDTINYDNTTTVDGGIFNNTTINNPTFTGDIGVGIEWVNEDFVGDVANSIFTLANVPSGDIQVSVLGGVIQIEPTDYTHTASTNSFEMLVDTTGLTLVVSYIKGTTGFYSNPNAVDVVYDNTTSGLTATDVQGAIDELSSNSFNASPSGLGTIPPNLTTTGGFFGEGGFIYGDVGMAFANSEYTFQISFDGVLWTSLCREYPANGVANRVIKFMFYVPKNSYARFTGILNSVININGFIPTT